jgi:N-acyl-phosphatidylethanolamine-hydrolysing phospholipase D
MEKKDCKSVQSTTQTKPLHHASSGTFQYPSTWPEPYNNHGVIEMAQLMKHVATTTVVIPDEKELPVLDINWELVKNPDPTQIQYTWIGHSTFLVQYAGVNVLTDPVFSERASMVQFAGPKRYRRVPCTVDQLPPIDVVVVSHNHYDHLDYYSILDLYNHHKGCTFYAPLKMGDWFAKNFEGISVKDLDWFDSTVHELKPTSNNKTGETKAVPDVQVQVTCLPCQHWSLRNGRDRNEVLWGSFGIKIIPNSADLAPRVLYHGGDTGYNNVCFKEIGEKYSQPNGGIDFAMIPIGAYEPRWFMKGEHINPEEAVEIALEIGAKKAVGMHWGTFKLTTEPVMEPKAKLEQNLRDRNLAEDPFFTTMSHGETRNVK